MTFITRKYHTNALNACTYGFGISRKRLDRSYKKALAQQRRVINEVGLEIDRTDPDIDLVKAHVRLAVFCFILLVLLEILKRTVLAG